MSACLESSDIKKVDKNPDLWDNMLSIGFEIINLDRIKNNDYNLVGGFYRPAKSHNSKIKLFGDLIEKGLIIGKKGKLITKSIAKEGNIPVISGGQTSPYSHDQANYNGNIITISSSGAYSGFVWYHKYPIWASDCSRPLSKLMDLILGYKCQQLS